MTFQAVARSNNCGSLVIGEITRLEAEAADNPMIDGAGIYLISVDAQSPNRIGEVLAKFVSEDAARELAKFFRTTGRLEVA